MKGCNSSLCFENEDNRLTNEDKVRTGYGIHNHYYLNKKRELSPNFDYVQNSLNLNQQKFPCESPCPKYQNLNANLNSNLINIFNLAKSEYESKMNKIQSLPFINKKIIIDNEEYIVKDPNKNITKNYSPKHEIKKKLMAKELDKYLKLQIQIKNIRDLQNSKKNKNFISDPIFDINLNTNPRIIKDPFVNEKTGKHKPFQMNLCLKPKIINEINLNSNNPFSNDSLVNNQFPGSQKENPVRKKSFLFNKMKNIFNPQITSNLPKNKSFDYSTIVNHSKDFNKLKGQKKYKSPNFARNAVNINKTNDSSKILNNVEFSDLHHFKRKSNPYLGFILRNPKKDFFVNPLMKRSIEKPKNSDFEYFENYLNGN